MPITLNTLSEVFDNSLWHLAGWLVRRFTSRTMQELQITSADTPRNVLVLAPHADDESISLGGTLFLHATAGDQVTVVVMTDGASCKRADQYTDIVSVRQQEARQVQAILGFADLIFWNCRDGDLGKCAAARDQLQEVLECIRPEVVYLPFAVDRHPDHVAANYIFAMAFQEAQIQKCEVRVYEGFFPLTLRLANSYVDVSSVADVKTRALGCYQSQTRAIDYVLPYSGKHSLLLPTRPAYSEVFFRCRASNYCTAVLRQHPKPYARLQPISRWKPFTMVVYIWDMVVRRGMSC